MSLVDPHIVWYSPESHVEEEGCGSLPGVFVQVNRPEAIVVQFLAKGGPGFTRKLKGFAARTAQHEIDHLNGILIIDRALRTK